MEKFLLTFRGKLTVSARLPFHFFVFLLCGFWLKKRSFDENLLFFAGIELSSSRKSALEPQKTTLDNISTYLRMITRFSELRPERMFL
jgi:hypothetical protein